MLTRSQIAAFVRDGYVLVPGAVPRRTTTACRARIDRTLAEQGIDVTDASTWSDPVVRVPWPATRAFATAAESLSGAYDQLIGPGAWTQFPTVGGTVPVRFPSRRRARDAVWHVDGSFIRDGEMRSSLPSPTRGLLCLILLSDIGPDDAPTELKVGSHADVIPILEPHGAAGCSFDQILEQLPASTLDRPSVFLTGRAGDAFVCHPFLVHRATARHRGDRPRYLAQPGMMVHTPFRVSGGRPRPVERAIRRSLGSVPAAAPSREPTAPATRTARTAATARTATPRTTTARSAGTATAEPSTARGTTNGGKAAPGKSPKARTAKPAPAKPPTTRAARPAPTDPSTVRAARPAPAKPSRAAAAKPAPAKPSRARAARPAPAKPSRARAPKPAPATGSRRPATISRRG